MMVIGIDPGPTHSAYCVVRPDYSIQEAGKVENENLRYCLNPHLGKHALLAIESIQSYGKPVGRETFETCYQIGKLMQIATDAWASTSLIPRQEYATAICGGKANDAMLRQALLLRFGSDKKDGPLYPLKGATDLRSAYAVAVYAMDREKWAANRPSAATLEHSQTAHI